jgi:hypothetical protein
MAAVLLILLVAVGARVAWWLLEPLVPVLVMLVVMGIVVSLAWRGRR